MTTGQKAVPDRVWACVLIGGQSRRMGQPKHLLPQAEATWIERTVAVLSPLVERVVIAGAGLLPSSLADLPRVADVPDLGGPLAGILAAFRAYPGVSWLMVACDMPAMEATALRWLLACRAPGVLAILPALSDDGRVEPLLAYYHHSCRGLLETLAASGRGRLQVLKTAQGVITPQPPLELRPSWRNINTPQELEQCGPALTRMIDMEPSRQ